MARRLHNEDATWFKWEITPDGDFQASCQVCQVILKRGFQFLTKGQCKLTRLKRHAMGPQHVASVCQMLGVTVETDRGYDSALIMILRRCFGFTSALFFSLTSDGAAAERSPRP